MTEPTQAVMVLGDAARDTAPAHQIAPDAPGTGYARTETGALQRVRASYVTDDQIRYLSANFPTPNQSVLDSADLAVSDLAGADAAVPGVVPLPSRTEDTGVPRRSRSPRKPRAPRTPRAPRGQAAS